MIYNSIREFYFQINHTCVQGCDTEKNAIGFKCGNVLFNILHRILCIFPYIFILSGQCALLWWFDAISEYYVQNCHWLAPSSGVEKSRMTSNPITWHISEAHYAELDVSEWARAALLGRDKARMSRGPDHQNFNTQRRACPLLEHSLHPMESNQCCYLHATTHTHASASNNAHANPYLPGTHCQRTPALNTTMPKIPGGTYTVCPWVFKITRVSSQC